ncbi:hypothetical protein CK203_018342 [Vitis vinifera]|uniref:Uncharacterized protein n=1 Tax=Vitis vinifera TaxID=29760 RepID=A0A438JPF9_VITVI|nr:hypothetical protein CK203_018342 [Vitis vinifera]
MMFFHMNLVTSLSLMLAYASASTHLLKLPHPSSSWANSTLANGPYVPESVLLNDFHILPRGETGSLYPDLVCLFGIFGQSAYPEIFCDVVRPFLIVCLSCLNGAASGGFCDRRVGLHMYRQQYGFFDEEGGNDACQGVGTSIFSSFDFFDYPLGESLTRSLETDRARARSNPDKMASYSASLLEAGNPSRMAAPGVPLLETVAEARLRTLMTAFGNIPTRSQPLLGPLWIVWVGIQSQTRSIRWPIEAFFRLSLVCVECYERVGRSARPPGGLGNRGGASRQHFEGLRLLAPFFNIWFLRWPVLC